MSELERLAPPALSRGRESLRRLAVSASMAASLVGLLALIASSDPAATLGAFFLSPFRARGALAALAEAAAPLAVCALGALTAFRAGHFSLGGEGQLYAGAFAAALAGIAAPPGPAGLLLAVAAGIAGGALVAAPAAAGKRFAGADVLLVSFLVSQAAIYAIDWAVSGPLKDPASNLVAMAPIPAPSLLPRIMPPTRLTPATPAALALAAALWFFMSRTREGAMLSLYGKNPAFARLQGFPVKALSWLPILFAGAAHGLAGSFLALGGNGTAVRGISGGLGWSAVGVTLVAGNEPLAVPVAALLFAWLDLGARQASILSDLPPDAAMAVKALVIMAATAKPFIRRLGAFMMAGRRA